MSHDTIATRNFSTFGINARRNAFLRDSISAGGKIKALSKNQRLEEKRVALNELLQLCKPISELDCEKELAQYRREKFGYANTH